MSTGISLELLQESTGTSRVIKIDCQRVSTAGFPSIMVQVLIHSHLLGNYLDIPYGRKTCTGTTAAWANDLADSPK